MPTQLTERYDAIVFADTVRIVGCAVFGLESGEIISMVKVAIMGKVQYTSLRDGIFARPTLAEALNDLLLAKDT